jgi:hypothetical protein
MCGDNQGDTQPAVSRTWPLAGLLAVLAAALSLIVTIRVWQAVGGQQAMWPLPALYLIEMLALPGATAIILLRSASTGATVAWVAAGAVSAFSVWGAWSVGLFYAPVALLLLAAGLVAVLPARRSILTDLAWAIAAAVLQSAIMLAAIGLL